MSTNNVNFESDCRVDDYSVSYKSVAFSPNPNTPLSTFSHLSILSHEKASHSVSISYKLTGSVTPETVPPAVCPSSPSLLPSDSIQTSLSANEVKLRIENLFNQYEGIEYSFQHWRVSLSVSGTLSGFSL